MRPESAGDKGYSVVVVTVAAITLRHAISRRYRTRRAEEGHRFTKASPGTGSPARCRTSAHNPGNKLSAKRHADFVLDGGPGSCKRSTKAGERTSRAGGIC